MLRRDVFQAHLCQAKASPVLLGVGASYCGNLPGVSPLRSWLSYGRQHDLNPLIDQLPKTPAVIRRPVTLGILLGYLAVVFLALSVGIDLAPGVGIDIGNSDLGPLPVNGMSGVVVCFALRRLLDNRH